MVVQSVIISYRLNRSQFIQVIDLQKKKLNSVGWLVLIDEVSNNEFPAVASGDLQETGRTTVGFYFPTKAENNQPAVIGLRQWVTTK